ncbi:hypothetical protein PHET_10648, partial [Paragonimus heterotremus]
AIIRKLRADSTIERGEPEGQSALSNKPRTADVGSLPESLYVDYFGEFFNSATDMGCLSSSWHADAGSSSSTDVT